MNQPLLSVDRLTHLYAPGKGFSNVSFDLWPGEVLGIVGESGSGKSVTSLALMGLIDAPGRITADSLTFDEDAFDPCI